MASLWGSGARSSCLSLSGLSLSLDSVPTGSVFIFSEFALFQRLDGKENHSNKCRTFRPLGRPSEAPAGICTCSRARAHVCVRVCVRALVVEFDPGPFTLHPSIVKSRTIFCLKGFGPQARSLGPRVPSLTHHVVMQPHKPGPGCGNF